MSREDLKLCKDCKFCEEGLCLRQFNSLFNGKVISGLEPFIAAILPVFRIESEEGEG